jgi:DNA-binding NtrC family response regulator
MVGASSQMQHVYREIRKVAGNNAPVLISGESGTGKELAAQAIHERSPQADGPFIAVNCGALPANLIQSELFGHEKGSFTGAHQRKIGRIEVASGGTLFLDEIGDLPMELQTNLLRFLQEKTIQRVGGREDITVDVRVIAATHVNLEKAVHEGSFREDLYYRLNVLQIKMPALRERIGDVPLLAQYIFRRFADEKGRRVKGFSEDALHTMNQYDWPGNVRELINRVRRAMVMCDKFLISPVDLGLERRTNSRTVVTLSEARDKAEIDTIRIALAQNMGNISLAAQQLGVSRVTLYRLMEKQDVNSKRKYGQINSPIATTMESSHDQSAR